MTQHHFGVFTRHAAHALDRRRSLAAIGTAALTACVARPSAATGAKDGKKVKKKCKRQDGACREFVFDNCANAGDPLLCVELLTPCCQFLGRCQAAAFFTCLEETAQSQP
jgi:hypothetical protein